MTDRSKLLALAEAVEKLTGPSNAIDAAIFADVFGFPEQTFQQRNAARPKRSPPLDRMTWLEGWGVSAYTASLDAAMTLVPEGCIFTARTVWDQMKLAGLGAVSRYEKSEFNGHEQLYWLGEHQAVAATPSLALCAAALRAQAEALA